MSKFIYAFKRALGNKAGSLKKNWEFDSKSIILTTPIVAQLDRDKQPEIFFGTKEGKLFSLDSNSNVKWIFDSKEKNIDNVELMFLDTDNINSISSVPNINDINNDGVKEIIFGSEMGCLYCLNNDGYMLWKFDAKSAIRGSPLIVDLTGDKNKEIIFGTLDGRIIVLSSRGELITSFKVSGGIESKPLLYKDKLIVGTNKGEIVCHNIAGKLFWNYKTEDKITAELELISINKKDHIVVGSYDNKLYCLTLDGEVVWTFETGGAIMSKVAVSDLNDDGEKEIIFGSCDNNVYCLTNNGSKIWSYETDFWVVSTPVLKDIDNDGHIEIIVGSYDHNLYILDSEGSYMLNYIPGLTGIINQSGSYSDIPNGDVEYTVGKKIWQFKADDMIVGCAVIDENNQVILNTKSGKINNLNITNN